MRLLNHYGMENHYSKHASTDRYKADVYIFRLSFALKWFEFILIFRSKMPLRLIFFSPFFLSSLLVLSSHRINAIFHFHCVHFGCVACDVHVMGLGGGGGCLGLDTMYLHTTQPYIHIRTSNCTLGTWRYIPFTPVLFFPCIIQRNNAYEKLLCVLCGVVCCLLAPTRIRTQRT